MAVLCVQTFSGPVNKIAPARLLTESDFIYDLRSHAGFRVALASPQDRTCARPVLLNFDQFWSLGRVTVLSFNPAPPALPQTPRRHAYMGIRDLRRPRAATHTLKSTPTDRAMTVPPRGARNEYIIA